MLPFEKLITSKSVMLLFIFLTSTSFGFLENIHRDEISRRSVRGNRVSMDRGYIEQLPFRRDISRHANEKDKVYENLYDRRSFRTGTDRQIRNHDRERFSNTRERYLEERSARLEPGNRFREQNDRLFDSRNQNQQDRSRSLIQNDRTVPSERSSRLVNDRRIRDNRIMGEIRQNRDERIFENRERDNISRQNRIGEQRERSLKNLNERLDDRNFHQNSAKENRERHFEHNNLHLDSGRFSQDSRAREVRQYRERTLNNRHQHLVTQDRRLERALPEIPSMRFREIRYQRRQILENRERSLNIREDPSSTFRNVRATTERSLDRQEQSLENRERVLIDRSSRHFRENRLAEIGHPERTQEHRYHLHDVRSPSERFSRVSRDNLREIRQQVERHLDERASRYSLSRRFRDTREKHERNLENRERETLPTVFRDTRLARENRQVSLENRNGYLQTSDRSSRSFRNNRSRQQRERDLENRDLQRTDRSSRRFVDDNIKEIRQHHERSLNNRDLYSEGRVSGAISFRLSRESRVREQRERNLSRDRFSRLTRNNIPEISNNRDVGNRFSKDQSTRTSRLLTDDSRYRNSDNRVARRTLENRYQNENGHLSRHRNILTRYERDMSTDTVRNDLTRASLSRSDSTRQTVDARINSRQLRNPERYSRTSRQEISNSDANQRNIERQMPTYRNTRSNVAQMRELTEQRRDTVAVLRSSNSLKSIEPRMVPFIEYQPNSGRSFERIADVQQKKNLMQNFKFDALANVIQVILGVYLLGQIFARSSKKKSFGFQRILPSLNFIKAKLE